MDYVKGIFKKRPNRFIAEVDVNGQIEIAHVPNTGRCKELLVENSIVWLKPSDNPNRKTKFSLHFVENRGYLVSIYSQEANSIVYDAIINGVTSSNLVTPSLTVLLNVPTPMYVTPFYLQIKR